MRYEGARDMALRILESERDFPGRTKMLTGDVSGAFKLCPLHADHVGRFAGTIPDLGILVIDLTCPFGWTGSPGHYWVAGKGINFLHASGAPRWPLQPSHAGMPFDGKAWCDDCDAVLPTRVSIGSEDDKGVAYPSLRGSARGPAMVLDPPPDDVAQPCAILALHPNQSPSCRDLHGRK